MYYCRFLLVFSDLLLMVDLGKGLIAVVLLKEDREKKTSQ